MTVEEVSALLLEIGFQPAGETPQLTVRIPTAQSPIFGGAGGKLRTLGGRARYMLPGCNLRCTVGPRTVNVYFSHAGKTEFILSSKTRLLSAQELRESVSAATKKFP